MGKTVPMLKEKSNEFFNIDPRNIVVIENFNVRKDYGNVKELADSIRENGVKVPLRGRRSPDEKGKYVLTHGHRRLEACLMLIKEGSEVYVPFILEGKGYTEEQRLIDSVICNDGKKLNPLEEAEAIKRLIEMEVSEKDIAKKISRHYSYVMNLKELADAPDKIKRLIKSNVLSSTLAMKILRENKDYDKAVEIIEKTLLDVQGENLFGEERKIKEKDIDKQNKKTNSFSELKKFFRQVNKEPEKFKFDESKSEMFAVLEQLCEGKLTLHDLKKILCLN